MHGQVSADHILFCKKGDKLHANKSKYFARDSHPLAGEPRGYLVLNWQMQHSNQLIGILWFFHMILTISQFYLQVSIENTIYVLIWSNDSTFSKKD